MVGHDLQVRPDEVCSQVGVCLPNRDQSKRLGSSIVFDKTCILSSFFFHCTPFSPLFQCTSIE